MGDLNYFLGVEVTRTATGNLHLCQHKYVLDLFYRCSLINAKTIHTHMASSSTLSKNDGRLLANPTDIGVLLKQQIVSRSTTEAEYRGLAAVASNVMWIISFAVAVATNLVLHSKFKHVKLDLFFVRRGGFDL
ncbi:alanine--tRNA ligase-like [Gossypium australe]|uniref:Alanine--tRNA ligase-like n=1 Tax=Gossypium australe TaxID=47621 RepID=A0A5B6VKC3_9ROSI|nr:alanine--tRNA ligase-like [Gossypium australe]